MATAVLRERRRSRRAVGQEPANGGRQRSEDRSAPTEAGSEARSHLGTDRGERSRKKIHWGTLNGVWVPHDTRDAVVDYVREWTEKTELPAKKLLGWLQLRESKFYEWTDRYGRANEHNGRIPRDTWLEDWEKQAIVAFQRQYPLEGYRRLAFMMLDGDVVAVS